MNVLLASNIDGITNQYPTDLGDVIKQLQGMLNYKSYSNVATAVQRVRPGSRGIGLNGSAEVAARILEMERSANGQLRFSSTRPERCIRFLGWLYRSAGKRIKFFVPGPAGSAEEYTPT